MENSMFSKLMEKKKKEGGMLSDAHKEARQSILHDLMDNMGSADAEPLKNLKKVSVSADSKEGLSEGLSKAKEMLGQDSEDEMEESPEHEAMESPEEEKMENSEEGGMPSREEMLAQIEELKSKLSKMPMKA